MNPLMMQCRPSRTQPDVIVRCFQKNGSEAGNKSDWKGQRRAWVAEKRQRRSSCQRHQPRGRLLDEGDPVTHSKPTRGITQAWSTVDPEYCLPTHHSRLPLQEELYYAEPVVRRHHPMQPLHGLRSGAASHLHAAPLTGVARSNDSTSASFTPPQGRMEPERRAAVWAQGASRGVVEATPFEHMPPPQYLPQDDALHRRQLEDEAWPSRAGRGLPHARRSRKAVQQLRYATGQASAVDPRTPSGGVPAHAQRVYNRQANSRWKGFHSSPQQEPDSLESRSQWHKMWYRAEAAVAEMRGTEQACGEELSGAAPMVLPQQDIAASQLADASSQSVQPRSRLQWSEGPRGDVQQMHSARAGGGPQGQAPTGSRRRVAGPAAVWEELSADKLDKGRAGAAHAPGAVWDRLFQPPAVDSRSSASEATDADVVGQDQRDTGASSGQRLGLTAPSEDVLCPPATPAAAAAIAARAGQGHEACVEDDHVSQHRTSSALSAQPLDRSAQAPAVAASAQFTAAGVAGASLFLFESLALPSKPLPSTPVPRPLQPGEPRRKEILKLPASTHIVASAAAAPLVATHVSEAEASIAGQSAAALERAEGEELQHGVRDSQSTETTVEALTLARGVLSTSPVPPVLDVDGDGALPRAGVAMDMHVPSDFVLNSSAAEPLPEQGKMVLATPHMHAPQLQTTTWSSAQAAERWQEQLPPRVRQVVAFAKNVSAAWHSVFPKKPEEQQRLEREIRNAVLRGDLHWSALNQVQQGKAIKPEQMAEANRMVQ